MAAESEFDLWRVITTATAGAVLAVGRWIFGLASRQRELESWRKIVDTKLEECDAASTGTHDAVIVMQEVVANAANPEEIIDGYDNVPYWCRQSTRKQIGKEPRYDGSTGFQVTRVEYDDHSRYMNFEPWIKEGLM